MALGRFYENGGSLFPGEFVDLGAVIPTPFIPPYRSICGRASRKKTRSNFVTEQVRSMGAKNFPAGPLARIKVIDLTHARAGPTCVRVLADHGAQVTQVARADPGGLESSFLGRVGSTESPSQQALDRD
jgi:hypothetical protein